MPNSPLYRHPAKPPKYSAGLEAEWAARQAGLSLFVWQSDFLNGSLALTEDERYLRTAVTLICPRRNGKTIILLTRILYGVLVRREHILYTSHLGDTSRAVFLTFLEMVNSHGWLADQVAKVSLGRGSEGITFKSGGTLDIRSRTNAGGRGRECDVLILDEGLELTDDHIAALSPLVAKAYSSGSGQVWIASSAGHAGSDELARVRDRGRASSEDDDGLYYEEFAAGLEDDPADPQTWAKANPSLGESILSVEFIRSQHRAMTPEAFRREHLGMWSTRQAEPLLPPGAWAACTGAAPALPARPRVAWGLEVQSFGERAALVSAVEVGDGRVWTETLARWHEPTGLDGQNLAGQILSHFRKAPVRPSSIAGDAYTCTLLLDHLTAARLPVTRLTAGQVREASGLLLSAVVGKRLIHPDDPPMTKELEAAGCSPNGDGLQRLSRKQSVGPSTAAFAVAAALHSLEGPALPKPAITLAS